MVRDRSVVQQMFYVFFVLIQAQLSGSSNTSDQHQKSIKHGLYVVPGKLALAYPGKLLGSTEKIERFCFFKKRYRFGEEDIAEDSVEEFKSSIRSESKQCLIAGVPRQVFLRDTQGRNLYCDSLQVHRDLIRILNYKRTHPDLREFSDQLLVNEVIAGQLTGKQYPLFACADTLVKKGVNCIQVTFTDARVMQLMFNPKNQLWSCSL